MGLENRPFIGTWSLNGKELVQHTPDALIYLNGDTALPGCSSCSGKIDIQQFITECSVDAGTEPGSASASFTLSVPLHHTESFARDAKFLLRPGLEVHIYMRGYFPVRGLYENLAEAQVKSDLVPAGSPEDLLAASSQMAPDAEGAGKPSKPDGSSYTVSDVVNQKNVPATGSDLANAQETVSMIETVHQYIEQQGYNNPQVIVTANGGYTDHGHASHSQHYEGSAVDFIVTYETASGSRQEVPRTTVWASVKKLQGTGHLPSGGAGAYLQGGQSPSANPTWSSVPHMDHRGTDSRWIWVGGVSQTGNEYAAWVAALQPNIGNLPEPDGSVATWDQNLNGNYPRPDDDSGFQYTSGDTENAIAKAEYGPSVLEELGLAGQGIEKALSYPYYPVFHGVVTEVSHSYSGGVNTISVNASSMLHFWQYQNMSTNASVFGARPTNSKNKMSMVGHNFTGMHPYEIMYTLHYDTAGAAGGVGWALSSKTNQSAVSTIGGESLFSLTLRYWEERFKGRVTKLRMHGATGALFSTMAAAWLSRTSSARLTRAIRSRYNSPKDGTGSFKILRQAQSLGLYNKGHRDALRYAARSRGGASDNQPKFELNILEMQAFVSNISNWGQVNLFESSYESKLDVAQKVCEITGFEFYQDVDGDFVFKPPMYNLDTSSSRVYRIEDIDIININISEKEPQITYMTVKGSHFKNLGVNGLENEWGVQGKYIDYPLVAKFGWRPGSYETAYFNDPKSMFFSAVNRMDIMNAGVNSASVTIPIRPELRPGYPVYIPYLDAYYYCNSFAHSHSVGGQCTTSLQLIAKRAKFYAPGRPNRGASGSSGASNTGISAIDLGDTLLPERPLQVWDQANQKPALAGFPNVVMALDPTGLNPLFFVIGTDIQNISDPKVLKQILDKATFLGVLTKPQSLGEGLVYFTNTQQDDPSGGDATPQQVAFYINDVDVADTNTPSGSLTSPAGGVVETTVNALAAAVEYEALVEAQENKTKKKRDEIRRVAEKISDKSDQLSDEQNKPDNKKNQSTIDRLVDDLATLEASRIRLARELADETNAAEEKWRDTSTGNAVAFLLDMIERTGSRYRETENFQNRSDLSNTVNLLDMLSDKKAIFSNGSQPGRYRYYSCSHPEKDQQGPQRLQYDGASKSRVVALNPETIEPQNQRTVKQFAAGVAPFIGAEVPEASLVDAIPTTGIRVLNSNPTYPNGEVLLTADIMELSFAVQQVQAAKNVTSAVPAASVLSIGKAAIKALTQQLKDLGAISDNSLSLATFFEAKFFDFHATHESGMGAVSDLLTKNGVSGVSFTSGSAITVPSAIQLWKSSVDTSVPISDFKYSGNSGGTISLGPRGSKATLKDLTDQAATSLGQSAATQFANARAALNRDLLFGGIFGSDREQYLSAYNTAVAAALDVNALPSWKFRTSRSRLDKTETYSPVFPISDDRGYEVVGSYRYGRGVDIDPSGVFAQLHKQDVFSLLSKDLVEQILKVFVQNGSITVPEMTIEDRNGTTVTVPTGNNVVVSGSAAERYLNEEALRQLRDQDLTDKQILDRRLAVMNDQTGQLEFGLSNYFADDSKDGIHKIPVINAAYSLGDLNVQRSGHICDCKAAEADVLLSAFGQQNFLSFQQAGSPENAGIGQDTADKGTRWVASTVGAATGAWEQQQRALRGEVLDRGGSSIVRQFADTFGIGEDNDSFITDALRGASASIDDVRELANRAAEQAANLTRPPDEDEG